MPKDQFDIIMKLFLLHGNVLDDIKRRPLLKTKDNQFDNFLSLVAPQIVITITYSANSDDKSSD